MARTVRNDGKTLHRRLIRVLRWLWRASSGFRGIWLLLLLLETLLPLAEVATAFLSRDMVDRAMERNTAGALRAALLFGCLLLIGLVLQVLISWISGRNTARCGHRLRLQLLNRLDRASWAETGHWHSGDLMTRMTGDVDVVADSLIEGVPKAVSTVVKIVASFGALLLFDPALAWVALLLGPLVGVAVRGGTNLLTDRTEQLLALRSRYMTHVQEWVRHLQLIRIFGYREKASERLETVQKDYLAGTDRMILAGSGMNAFFSVGFNVGYLLAFVWGVFRLAAGQITFGTLTAFVQLVVQVQEPFADAGTQFAQLLATAVCTERLQALEGDDASMAEPTALPMPDGPVGVRLERVSFAYDTDREIFSDIDLDIRAGQLTALMGPSGEGKTTLVRLLLALVRPVSGRVQMVPVGAETNAELTPEVPVGAETRGWIAYVPQDSGLMYGTVRDNLLMGNPRADDAMMEEALTASCAWPFLKETGGLDTEIGENGGGLSAGQMQRIALARALVRSCPLLLLDEATAALDTETEGLVLENLRRRVPGQTIVLITHRPSAAAFCDSVVRLENGVFQCGTGQEGVFA